MRHLAPLYTEPGAHAYPVQRIEADDGRISELAGEHIVEPLAQATHRFLRAIARYRCLPAKPQRAQIIDAMAMIGVIVRPKNAIYPIDIIG